MIERKSSLFPDKKNRPHSSGMRDIQEFSNVLESQKIESNRNGRINQNIDKNKDIKNPNKSHKGIAGRKTEYSDPRLKKDQNTKVSMSTKLRIQRLIARKFDGKSEGDVIDIALDYLVSSFDRDDRDSLYKAYKEDMDSIIPVVNKKNADREKKGLPFIELTDAVNKDTLKKQKDNWVSAKFE